MRKRHCVQLVEGDLTVTQERRLRSDMPGTRTTLLLLFHIYNLSSPFPVLNDAPPASKENSDEVQVRRT